MDITFQDFEELNFEELISIDGGGLTLGDWLQIAGVVVGIVGALC